MTNHGWKFLFVTCLTAALASSTARASDPTLTWTQISPTTSPSARSYPAMAYDKVIEKIVIFGGFSQQGYLQDTWTFDGTTWEKITTVGAPPARTNAQMAYDMRTRKIVLFGGYDGSVHLGDTWVWDGATSTWAQAAPIHSPTAASGPMVFTDLNGRVDEFGGFTGAVPPYNGTMWQWSGSTWRRLQLSEVPYARSSAALAVDSKTKRIVLYGGLTELVNPLNTWTYDGTTWTMEDPAMQPQTVYAASAAFDPNLGVILFGGAIGGVAQGRSWSWTGSTWAELFPTLSPPAREGAGMVYDPTLGHIVIFGGQSQGLLLGDTWELTYEMPGVVLKPSG
jgi:hypothetical protein